MLYGAAREYIEKAWLIRSMTTNFVGPLLFGISFQTNVEILREGNSYKDTSCKFYQISQCI
jgi:acyl-CoA thioesterase